MRPAFTCNDDASGGDFNLATFGLLTTSSRMPSSDLQASSSALQQVLEVHGEYGDGIWTMVRAPLTGLSKRARGH